LELKLDQTVRKKVYVVDDDDAVRDSMCIFLESCGLDVREFRSAREFLATLCAHPTGCLLLDLHMPEMNGLELLELLRERGSQLPVVMFTGRSDSALKERALRSGAVMLDKPVSDDILLGALDRAFEAAAA
jgi:two-component system response regulator FixJ